MNIPGVALLLLLTVLGAAIPRTAHAAGDDTLYLFFPHSRLIDAQTGIIANRNTFYIDAGPGQMLNVRLGGMYAGRIQAEVGTGSGNLHSIMGWNVRAGLHAVPPLFIAVSGGYYVDERDEFHLGFWLFYEGPWPKHWKTYITKVQLHISALPSSALLLTMNTGYTSYSREGTRAQVPITFGVMYELLPFVLLKGEADYYTRQEELQNTSYYAGFAVMLPFADLELGYLYHKGYGREEGYNGPYVCAAVYL